MQGSNFAQTNLNSLTGLHSTEDTVTEQAGLAVKLVYLVGKCSILITAETCDILIHVFRFFPQFFQADAGIVFLLGHDRFLPNPNQSVIISHPTSQRCVVCTLRASFNNPQQKEARHASGSFESEDAGCRTDVIVSAYALMKFFCRCSISNSTHESCQSEGQW
jgi:hypothetical protein